MKLNGTVSVFTARLEKAQPAARAGSTAPPPRAVGEEDPAKLRLVRGPRARSRDGCAREPTIFLDSEEMTGLSWDGCRGSVGVVHYRWNGGGHGSPPSIDGVPTHEAIWRFLADYSLPPAH